MLLEDNRRKIQTGGTYQQKCPCCPCSLFPSPFSREQADGADSPPARQALLCATALAIHADGSSAGQPLRATPVSAPPCAVLLSIRQPGAHIIKMLTPSSS